MAGHNLLSATPTTSLAVFYTGFSYSEEDKLGSIVCSEFLKCGNLGLWCLNQNIKMCTAIVYIVQIG